MENFQFQTEGPLWLVIVCLLVGAGYAFLLYSKKAVWGSAVNYVLAVIRAVSVAFLCFLLLGPFLKRVVNYYERPTIVFAIDDSESIRLGQDSAQARSLVSSIFDLAAEMEANDVDAKVINLEGVEIEQPADIKFDRQETDLSRVLSDITARYSDNNLASVYLVSDGIYNKGFSPAYAQQLTPINTLALGDTVPKKDIAVTEVLYNKISYAGNRFPIVARIRNTGFTETQIKVKLISQGKVLDSRTVKLQAGNDIREVEFYHTENKTGRRHYAVVADILQGEAVRENNTGHAYLEIIENRDEILLLASAPHPDLKAIRTLMSQRENFNLTIYIPGISKWNNEIDPDLVIFHQLPRKGINDANVQRMLEDTRKAKLFIITSHTDLAGYNQLNSLANIAQSGNKVDEVKASLATGFQRFAITEETAGLLSRLPPIKALFSDINLKPSANTILWQKVGSVITQRPMLAVSSTEPRTGIFVGDGLWQWRLSEFEMEDNTDQIDELFLSTFKYLSSKADKRKFRIIPAKDEFNEQEQVVILAEIYDDIYEPVYGESVSLTVTDGDGKQYDYSFTTTPTSKGILLKGLPSGVYDVRGTISRSGGVETSVAQFSINESSLEAINTTADHGILRNIASSSGGSFYSKGNLDRMMEEVKASSFPSTVTSEEEKSPLIELHWIFWILLSLIALEWLLRKFKGEY